MSRRHMTRGDSVYGPGTHAVEYEFPKVDGWHLHGWGPIKGPWPEATCLSYIEGRAKPERYRVVELPHDLA